MGDSRLKLILPGKRSGISHSPLEVIKIIFEFGKKISVFLYFFKQVWQNFQSVWYFFYNYFVKKSVSLVKFSAYFVKFSGYLVKFPVFLVIFFRFFGKISSIFGKRINYDVFFKRFF